MKNIKEAKPKGKKVRITPLGYLISIGGMLFAIFAYFFLGIDRYFLGLHGTLGLSDILWVFIGGMIWLFAFMAIVTVIFLKLKKYTIREV